jgi:hypothetical protein
MPFDITFDRSGNLWVLNNGAGTVTEYTKAQIAKSGSPMPAKTINYSGSDNVLGERIDPSGDLWVSTGTNLVEFSKAQLEKAVPAPSVVISSPAVALGGLLAFDSQGDLWGTIYNNQTLVELTKAQLSRSGAPTPRVTISSNLDALFGGTLAGTGGLAVEASGNVWVADGLNNRVVEFSKAQLTKSGALVPTQLISGPKTGLNGPTGVQIAP